MKAICRASSGLDELRQRVKGGGAAETADGSTR